MLAIIDFLAALWSFFGQWQVLLAIFVIAGLEYFVGHLK